jgi:hypothetical protein
VSIGCGALLIGVVGYRTEFVTMAAVVAVAALVMLTPRATREGRIEADDPAAPGVPPLVVGMIDPTWPEAAAERRDGAALSLPVAPCAD